MFIYLFDPIDDGVLMVPIITRSTLIAWGDCKYYSGTRDMLKRVCIIDDFLFIDGVDFL